MITIYSVAYNEEIMMQFFIDHYRDRFPQSRIVIYDNESTDNTVDIVLKNNCEVIPYYTNNQIDDEKLRVHKNNCWKNADTDWVLVCDADELLDIHQSDLLQEDALGTTMIKSEGYNMTNLEDNYDLAGITHGILASQYSKDYLFKRTNIQEINYNHGAHFASPIGDIRPSRRKYKAYHYTRIHPELTYKKHLCFQSRLSELNRRNGWGFHYNVTSFEEIESIFKNARAMALRIR